MFKSLIELRRNARGEKFKQFFFSSNHQNCIMVSNVPRGDAGNWSWELWANKRPTTTSGSRGCKIILKRRLFFSAWQGWLPHLSGVPHLHANKPLKGRRYESFNLVTCQTTYNCVTLILTSRFWHDRSSCHAFAACSRKQTGECWCTSPPNSECKVPSDDSI